MIKSLSLLRNIFLRFICIATLAVSFLMPLASVSAATTDTGLGLKDDTLTGVKPKKEVSVSDITTQINTIANIVVGIVAAICVFYIIYGAWLWMSNEPDKGKKTVVNAVIGLVIAILSFLIVRFTVGAGVFLNKSL